MKHGDAKFYWRATVGLLHKLEDTLLVGMLAAMLLLAFGQIIARNLFQTGIVWGDLAVKVMVLWVGLVGAMVAARQNKHITIDTLSRYLPPKLKRPISAVLNLFAAVACGVAAYASFRFVHMEYLDGAKAFGNVPIWITAAVIPLALGVMALRYLMMMMDRGSR